MQDGLRNRSESGMEHLSEKRQHAVERVMASLVDVDLFNCGIESPPVLEFENFDGAFRKQLEVKLRKRVSRHRGFPALALRWKRIEVRDFTGNEILRVMLGLCDGKEFGALGECVVFTLDAVPDGALCSLDLSWLEYRVPVQKDMSKKGLYEKIFDEQQCLRQVSSNTKRRQFYTEKLLHEAREEAAKKLNKFLNEAVQETSAEYRQAFIGMLVEIVKRRTRHAPIMEATRIIPLEACMWLAMSNGLSHKLQAVFGDHQLPVHAWESSWKAKNPNINRDELSKLRIKRKALLRLRAAQSLIEATIPVEEDGTYDERKVRSVKEDVRKFFHVSNS